MHHGTGHSGTIDGAAVISRLFVADEQFVCILILEQECTLPVTKQALTQKRGADACSLRTQCWMGDGQHGIKT